MNDIKRLLETFEQFLEERNEKYVDYKKNEADAVIKKLLYEQTEYFFATLFEDLRPGRSLLF